MQKKPGFWNKTRFVLKPFAWAVFLLMSALPVCVPSIVLVLQKAALSRRCWRSAQEECASGTLKQSQCRVSNGHGGGSSFLSFKARILSPRTTEASGTFLWISLHGSLWVSLIRISALLVCWWWPRRSSGFSRAALSFIQQKGEEKGLPYWIITHTSYASHMGFRAS